MENKRLIMLFGILFSVVFCLMYYVLFSFTLGKANDDKRTLYMNQVGLYEKAQSVQDMQEKLEKEGLVTIEPRKGAYASDVSIKDMVDVLEVREDLEAMAAAMAAQRVNEEEKKNLIDATLEYKRAVESEKTEDIIKADEKFHQLIVNYSGNKTLVQLFSQVQELALRFRYLYYDDFSRYEGMPMEHREIEEAILSGDFDKARVAAGAHVKKLKQFVEDEGEKIFQGTEDK